MEFDGEIFNDLCWEVEDFEEEIKKFEKFYSVDEFIETDFVNDSCWEVEDFEEEIEKFEKFYLVDETRCVDKSCREFDCVDDEFRELEQNFFEELWRQKSRMVWLALGMSIQHFSIELLKYALRKEQFKGLKAMFTSPSPLLGFEGVVLFALKTSLILFIESGAAGSYDLFIEVGCSIVVNWINKSIQRPWRWWHVLVEIDRYISDVNKAVSCSAVFPSNGMAAWLANYGVFRKDVFKVWC
ncbi:hypothetical protein GQ457_05G032660 [Hibiscus cannabinus]